MNTLSKAAKSFCLCVAIAACASPALAAGPDAEVAALHAVDQAWLKAYNGGNAETLASLYDEDAVLLPAGAPAVHGRAAIREFFAKDTAASAKGAVKFRFGPSPDGGVSGDMGWASGTYVVMDKSGQVLDKGKYLSVSVKKGGHWLYLRDTWNSDLPPAGH